VADLSEPLDSGGRAAERRAVVVLDRRRRGLPLALRASLPVYVSAIVLAELLVAFVSPLAGVLVDAAVVLCMANHQLALATGAAGAEDGDHGGDLLPALALVPFLRLCSLALPLAGVPEAYWQLAVGTPVLLAAGIVARTGGLRHELRAALARRGSRAPRAMGTGVGAVAGLVLGLPAYLLLEPRPPASTAVIPLLAASVGVVICGAVLEEVVFRGLLQRALRRALGGGGVALGCVLYAAVYLGTDSVAAVAFFAALGALLAVAVERTGSLRGAIAAHGVLSFWLLIVWPLALG
jgi:uncharacterized protein